MRESECRGSFFGSIITVCTSSRRRLTIGWSDRGSRLRWAKEGVDDWDKVPSVDAGEAPRRSTSSLESDCRRAFLEGHNAT